MRSFGVEGPGGAWLQGDPPARERRWTAIVLAGSRPEADPLAAHFDLPLKALVPVAGVPMIAHVVSCLASCPSIARIVIVAQQPALLDCAELRALADRFPIDWAAGGDGIAESVAMHAGSPAAPWPVLVTTADNPLLTPEVVEHFLGRSGACDASVAVVARDLLVERYPQSRRTWLRFRAGAYTGANLFTARTPASAPSLQILARAESSRKKQLRLLWHFGPAAALGALTRTMTIREVVERFGMRLGLKPEVVVLPYAEAGIDVDSLEDWELAEVILRERGPAPRADGLPQPAAIFDLDRTSTRRGTYAALSPRA